MTLFPGSMMEQVQRVIAVGDKVGVLVVDEQGDQSKENPYPEMKNQQAVLRIAIGLNLPIWLVEINQNPDSQPNLPTRIQLRALLPGSTPILTEAGLNAFHNTNLHILLGAAGIDTILIMGYATNQCVKLTAIGGYTARNNQGTFIKGAYQMGYTVVTCQQILRGGQAGNWIMTPGVEFYPAL